MDVVDIRLDLLRTAPWNPNLMAGTMLEKSKASIVTFGTLENLVVRPIDMGMYEVLGGNQRLKLYRELGVNPVPCVITELNDTQAALLGQALNQLHGEDDLGLKAELVRRVLAELPESQVLAILPETSESLQALTTLGQEDLAADLLAWQQAQSAKLKNLQFRLTATQLETVHEALDRIKPVVREAQTDNPNTRGNALHLLCQMHLERERTLP